MIQPEGPYFLGGASFGGIVALEMAQQLHTLGQKIALLCMIDSADASSVENLDSNDMKVIAYALGLGFSPELSTSAESFKQLDLEEQARYFFEHGKMAHRIHSEAAISNIHDTLRNIEANIQAMVSYIPKVYQGRILFFRAREQYPFMPKNPELSWINLATEGLKVHEIPGNHISMNLPPHVEVMATKLKTYL